MKKEPKKPSLAWRDPVLWLASLILGACLIEGCLWIRQRVNTALQQLEIKVANEKEMTRQYTRQSEAQKRLADKIAPESKGGILSELPEILREYHRKIPDGISERGQCE